MQRMRRSIDRHPERWREVFNNAEFRRVYFPEVKSNASADAAIKAFTQRNQDNALKKRPMVGGFCIYLGRTAELIIFRDMTWHTPI